MQKDIMNEKKLECINETIVRGSLARTVAKIVRVVSVPPVMVSALIILLAIFRRDVVSAPIEGFMAILFLAVVPTLAYPLSAVIPSIREKGRKGQRDLAIYLSIAGYIGGVIYGFAAGVGRSLLIIFCTYLLSVVMLLVCNLFHIKASGHACSVSGPIVLIAYFFGLWYLPVCAALYAAIFWASVYMGRHTVREFILGSLSSPLATAIVVLISTLI